MTVMPIPGPEGPPDQVATAGPATEQRYGPGFWVAVALGWTVVLGAFLRIVVPRAGEQALRVAVWFVACNLAVDLIVMPVTFLVAKAGRRVLPVRWRPAAVFALATSAVLTLFSFPAVRRYGARADNPSVLPLDYGRNLALVVAVVVAASVVFTVAMSFRRNGTENGTAAGQPPVAGRVSGR